MEPVAVLGAVARPALDFDPNERFDRLFFGLKPEDVHALGDLGPHLLEVAWEALERSGVDLTRLGEHPTALLLAVGPDAGERTAGTLATELGLSGPVVVLAEEGAALVGVHLATQLLRAGGVDLAVVLGALGEGVAALVLGRPQDASENGWRVRALLLGSDVSGEDESVVRARAIQVGGLGEDVPGRGGSDLGGLIEAVEVLGRGGVGATVVSASAEVTSAAVVVSAAEQTQIGEGLPRWLTLSARTAPALTAMAAEVSVGLGHDSDLGGMAADTLSRPAFERRLAVPCHRGATDVSRRLRAFSRGERGQVAAGRIADGGVAFVVPPAGAQSANMAERLYDTEPTFRDALVRCDKALRHLLPRPLMSAMYPAEGRELPTDDPVLANPMTFALGFALAEAYRAHGIVPDAVLGCGVGELLAATLAGVLDLEQAIVLAAERGRLVRTLDAECARLSVEATEEALRELVLQVDGVDIVAVPMPDRTIVGGTPQGITELEELLSEQGLGFERMVGHPAHSPLVEPVLEAFEEAAAKVKIRPARILWVSTATGRELTKPEASHWGATLRAPLRYAIGIESLYEQGCRTFVELAAHPTMVAAGQRTLHGSDARWLSALIPGLPDDEHTDAVLAELWVRGASLERGQVGRPPGSADLPTYRWDRRSPDAALEPSEDAAIEDHIQDTPAPALPDVPLSLMDPDTTLVPPEEQSTEEVPRTILDGGVLPPLGEGEEPTAETEEAELSDGIVPIEGSEELSEDGLPPAPVEAEAPDEVEPEGAVEPVLSELQDLSVDSSPRLVPAPDEPETDLSEPTGEVVSATRDLIDLAPPTAPPPPPPDAPAPVEDDVEEPEEPEAPEPIEELPATALEDLSVDAAPEELEEIETDAYTGTPKALEEAEALADAALVWRERWVEAPVEAGDGEPATWVILADGEGLGDYLAALLIQQGHTCYRVLNEQPYPRDDGTLFVPDPAAAGAWDPVIETLGTLHGRVRVVHLWSLDVFDDAEADARAGWPSVVELAQELQGRGMRMPIQIVTRGAVLRPDAAVSQTGGSLWGVGRLLAREAPKWFAGLVDLDPEDEDADMLLEHLVASGVGEFAFRDGTRYGRVVERVEPTEPPQTLDDSGAWVVGGDIDSGSLQVARWLADGGIGRVFLVGPRPPAADVLQGVLELQRQGVMCIVVRADLSDDTDLDRVRQRLAHEGELGGVVVHHSGSPGPLMGLGVDEAVERWRDRMRATERFGELAGERPLWVWAEGRGLEPRAGDGLGAITGAARDSWTRARAGDGVAVSIVHTSEPGALSPGQTARLVGRLSTAGSASGAWRPAD